MSKKWSRRSGVAPRMTRLSWICSPFQIRLKRLWCKPADVASDDGQMPRFVSVEELFRGRHFDQEVVIMCVRWYLSFKLSYRDLVAMMGERAIEIAHTTILRWVQYYTPDFEKRWNRYARAIGGSWRMDETYVRVKGEWIRSFLIFPGCPRQASVPSVERVLVLPGYWGSSARGCS